MAKAMDILEKPESAPLLEQLAGHGRGRVFELSIDEIRLGREDDNDIVISDESVSRLHAKIERNRSGEYIISDNQSKNGVIVNKQKVDSCTLGHGDIIQLGHFVFRFRVPGVSSPNLKIQSGQNGLASQPGTFSLPATTNRKRFYLYGGVALLLGAVYMMSGDDSSKPKEEAKSQSAEQQAFKPSEVPALNEKAPNTQTEGLEDPLNKTEKEISNLENRESYVKESESYFRRGQRDYFNKNYHHAIDNFDAAISIWGQHPLAAYYRGLAAHESEVEAEKNREIGLKYYNSLQYGRAMYHFKSAIDNLSHAKPDNLAAKRLIQECERYIEFARRKLKAAELVP